VPTSGEDGGCHEAISGSARQPTSNGSSSSEGYAPRPATREQKALARRVMPRVARHSSNSSLSLSSESRAGPCQAAFARWQDAFFDRVKRFVPARCWRNPRSSAGVRDAEGHARCDVKRDHQPKDLSIRTSQRRTRLAQFSKVSASPRSRLPSPARDHADVGRSLDLFGKRARHGGAHRVAPCRQPHLRSFAGGRA